MDEHPPPAPPSPPVAVPLPAVQQFHHAWRTLLFPALQACMIWLLGRYWGYTNIDAFQLFSTAAALTYITPHVDQPGHSRLEQRIWCVICMAQGLALLGTLSENAFLLGLGLCWMGIRCIQQTPGSNPLSRTDTWTTDLSAYAASALLALALWSNISVAILTILAYLSLLGMFIRMWAAYPAASPTRARMAACGWLCALSICFFACSYEMPSASTLLEELQATDLFAHHNGYWVLCLGPLLTRLYYAVISRPLGTAAPWACCLGLLLTSMAFLLIPWLAQQPPGVLPIGSWVWLNTLLWGLGDVLFSAGGLILILQWVPAPWRGLMVITWHLTPGLGAAALDWVNLWIAYADTGSQAGSSSGGIASAHAMDQLGIALCAMAVCWCCLIPFLHRLLPTSRAK